MDIEDSLNQLLKNSDRRFADRFYRVLFENHPDIEEHFADIDIRHQGALLTMSLSIVVAHDRECNQATENYLKVLGHRHYRHGVTKHDYDRFCDALLLSLSKFHGPQWSDRLADQWRAAMENAIDTMLRGHTDDQIIY